MKDTDITKLIPQRAPILMVDRLIDVTDDSATTCLTVRPELYLVDEENLLTESGVIEHIAQSASAFAGYKALVQGVGSPPMGYIGEVKKFHCFRCPRTGEVLHTVVTMEATVEGVTMLMGETRIQEEVVAVTRMKIFIHDNRETTDRQSGTY